MKTDQMYWTSPAGNEYAVTLKNDYYHLTVNGHFEQLIKVNNLMIDEAARILVNQYNEASEAERQYFKNNPGLNP